MVRWSILAAVAVLVLAAPVEAKRAIRLVTPIEKVARADAVVVGKVTAIEKETVSSAPAPGAPEKVAYKVAVIKVESGLHGAAGATHVKVGFVPAPKDEPPPPGKLGGPRRGGYAPVVLTEGMEGLFYLTKHHSGAFYTINPMFAPTEAKAENYKTDLAQAKSAVAVLADPMKALKADKPADRGFAAIVLVTKYRSYPETAVEVAEEKVPAEESKLVLKGLTEANWKPDPNDATAPNAYMAFNQLGLTDKDGWKFPMVKPGEEVFDKTKEAFAAWLAGPGKDYQIRTFVVKKK